MAIIAFYFNTKYLSISYKKLDADMKNYKLTTYE